ncbi:dynamin-related protein 4C, partial [Tanacetum coccineum]
FLMTNHCQGDCVYLNVTSAAKDLNLHKSTKVLAEFDQSGKRTVSVVTYDDKCSEDSLLRFTSIIHTKKPLGYVLIILKSGVSTDIDEGSSLYDYVKAECYGYGSLSKNVMLASTLGPILKRVNADLESCSHAKKDLKKKIEIIGDAWETFLSIVDSSQRSLDKLMIGKIYREYREDVKMHTSTQWTVKRVVSDHAKEHSELRGDLDICVDNSIEIARSSFNTKVQDIIALEKSCPFIVFAEAFNDSWNDFKSLKSDIVDLKDQDWVKIHGFNINVGLSKKVYSKEWSNDTWKHAFDLKMYVAAYWDVLSQRLVNQFVINLLSTLKDLVNGGMRLTMTKYLYEMEKDTKLMEEEPEVVLDRVNSKKREEHLGDLKKEIQDCLVGVEFLLRERGKRERVKLLKGLD